MTDKIHAKNSYTIQINEAQRKILFEALCFLDLEGPERTKEETEEIQCLARMTGELPEIEDTYNTIHGFCL